MTPESGSGILHKVFPDLGSPRELSNNSVGNKFFNFLLTGSYFSVRYLFKTKIIFSFMVTKKGKTIFFPLLFCCFWIRDGNQSGPGINIPDPQVTASKNLESNILSVGLDSPWASEELSSVAWWASHPPRLEQRLPSFSPSSSPPFSLWNRRMDS